MITLTHYRDAQDLFDRTLAALPAEAYPGPTRCTDWTVADIAGHVSWGQDYVRHLAQQQPYADRSGAPGTAHPAGRLAGTDPLTGWRVARTAADGVLTEDALQAPPPAGLAKVPGTTLGTFLDILAFDFVLHAWDIGDPHGIAIEVPDDRLARIEDTAHRVVSRRPGFFGPELPTPPRADRFGALLAFTGRRRPRPAP